MSFQSAIESRFGMKIITDHNLVDVTWFQVRFPRSKKRRIRKKWSMQRKNFKIEVKPKTTIYRINGDTLIMHPTMLERLKYEIGKQATQRIASLAGFRFKED